MLEALRLMWAYDPAETVGVLVSAISSGLALLFLFVAVVNDLIK